jgi:hypothetical protein
LNRRLRAALVGGFLGGALGWVYPLVYHRVEPQLRQIFALEYMLVGASLGFALSNYFAFRRHMIEAAWRRKNTGHDGGAHETTDLDR